MHDGKGIISSLIYRFTDAVYIVAFMGAFEVWQRFPNTIW